MEKISAYYTPSDNVPVRTDDRRKKKGVAIINEYWLK